MDGLQSSSVNNTTQDLFGRLWFSTRSGLSVFDGQHWANYSVKDGFYSNEFYAVVNDNQGNIWAMAKNSFVEIIHFPKGKVRSIRYSLNKAIKNDNTYNKTFAVYVDKTDTVFVTGTANAGLIVCKNMVWSNKTASNGLPSEKIWDVSFHDGLFYILTDNGIVTMDKELSVKPVFNELIGKDIKELKCFYFDKGKNGKNTKIWFLGDSFISLLEDNKYSRIVSGIKMGEMTSVEYPKLFPDYHGLFFFGSSKKLFIYDQSTKKTTNLVDRGGSSFAGITSAFKDIEDNLWITSDRGISKVQLPIFTNLNTRQGLFKDEVTAVTQVGNTMVFGHEGGITIAGNGKIKKIDFGIESVRKADLRVLKFLNDKDGNVWFAASRKGLGRLNSKMEVEWFSLPKEEEFTVLSLAQNSIGELFVSTLNSIYRYGKDGFIRENMGNKDFRGGYRSININGKDEILIGTMGRGVLHKISENNLKLYKSSSLITNNVYGVCYYKGRMLVGSQNGLYYVNGDSLKKDNDIRIDRPVYFIGKDKETLWIGTDYGVALVKDDGIIRFTPQENLAGLETNRGAFFVDNGENVWIGTDKGVSKYLSNKMPQKIVKPGLFVGFSEQDGKISLFNKKIELTYSNNAITLNIKVISFLNEDRNTYLAKLENFDSEWLPEKKDGESLRYTNLPAGTYRLRIKGRNVLGIWSDEYVSPEIIVLSPIYLQWWFIAAAVVCFVGIIYFIINFLSKIKYATRLKISVEEKTAQLRESETKYKNLVNNMYEGVYVVQNNVVKFINQSMAELIGYSVEELIGSEWSNYAYEEDIPMLLERNIKRIQGHNIGNHFELRMKHKNGKILNVISNASLINYENAPAVFGTLKDVTEKKVRESQLNKLFTAVQQSPSSVIITDPNGIVEYVNPVFEKITGFSSNEIIGGKTNVIKSGLTPESVYKELWSTISGGNIWRGELLNMRCDKELFWVRVSIAPVKNIEGEITNYIAVEEDITFEKFAREEIEKKEKLLSTTLDKAPIIVFVLDNSGRFTFIKGNGLDLLGFIDEKEMIGKPVGYLFGDDEELEHDLKKAMAHRSFATLKFAHGFVFEVHYTAINKGLHGDSATIGLAINITDYYNAEQTIKESESKIRALLKAIPDYMFEVNKERVIITYHQPLEDKMKFSSEDIQGKTLKQVFSDVYSEVEGTIGEVFLTGESKMKVFSFIYNDERKYFEARFVLKDEDRVLAIVREVTDRVIAETELIKAKEVAERSDRLKSEFLAHMSHEIRTPVNTILNFTSLMEEELYDKVSVDLKDGFQVINDGGMRLIRTIDLILNMSQIQTGTYNPNFRYIDVNKEILSRIIQEFHYRAKRKNLDLIYKMEAVNSVIYADDYTMGQIFVNLIDNALKYTNEGIIEVFLKNINSHLVVEVADTGIGISNEYLPNLFSPFTQEEMGYTRRFDGTGLGLALVKKYVEINNAEIYVESVKDKGAKFAVHFPISADTE